MSAPGNRPPAGFPDRGPAVFAVTTATLALATVFVAARMVSRIAIVRRTGWDDYLLALAWLIALFLGLSIDLGTKRGLGRHESDIDPATIPGLRLCEYVFSILYVRTPHPLNVASFARVTCRRLSANQGGWEKKKSRIPPSWRPRRPSSSSISAWQRTRRRSCAWHRGPSWAWSMSQAPS